MTTTAIHYDRRAHGGFTLIEMLAVITILVILISLVVTTGVLVIGRQSQATTRGLLSSLDRALEEYLVEADAFPPFIPESYVMVPGRKIFADSASEDNTFERYQDRDQARHPDASVFLRQAQGIGVVNSIISGIGDRFTVTTEIDADGERDTTPSIIDAWGDSAGWIATSRTGDDDAAWAILHNSAHLIFYVHPDNRLAQDLYGRCVNGRPYFFSAGPDGVYGTTSQFSESGAIDPGGASTDLALEGLEDNLYSYKVGPPHDDEHFNGESR